MPEPNWTQIGQTTLSHWCGTDVQKPGSSSKGPKASAGLCPFEEGKTAKIGTPKNCFASHDGGASFLEELPLPQTAVAFFPAGPTSLKRTDCTSVTLSLRDPVSLENKP